MYEGDELRGEVDDADGHDGVEAGLLGPGDGVGGLQVAQLAQARQQEDDPEAAEGARPPDDGAHRGVVLAEPDAHHAHREVDHQGVPGEKRKRVR